MIPETTTEKSNPAVVDNELDIRGLCCTLWGGKKWIIGFAVLFAMVALMVSYLVKQEWSATAITDRPTVNALGGYYSQQQFLRNLDARTASAVSTEQPKIADEAYNEFIMQLASYDTRRDFWLQSDYYRQRQEGNTRADAVLLDDLINDIQVVPRDDKKVLNDSVKLTVETALDANRLLREYVVFASSRAAQHLNEETQGTWTARTTSLQAQVKRQEAVAETLYQRELNIVQQALKTAQQQGIAGAQTDISAEKLPDSDLFLLGKTMLQARLEALRASGPTYDMSYDQDRAMLATLNTGPTLDAKFQAYRYLRTPEEPVKRDSPRRVFWLIMWGAIGGLVGTGVVLVRRRS